MAERRMCDGCGIRPTVTSTPNLRLPAHQCYRLRSRGSEKCVTQHGDALVRVQRSLREFPKIAETIPSARRLAPSSRRPSFGPSRRPFLLRPALLAFLLRVVPTPSFSKFLPAPLPFCVALHLRIPLSAVPVSKVPVRHAASPPSIPCGALPSPLVDQSFQLRHS